MQEANDASLLHSHFQLTQNTNILLPEQLNQLGIHLPPDAEDEIRQLDLLLNNILAYPSTSLAHIHRKSNRLGTHDLQSGGSLENGSYRLEESNLFGGGDDTDDTEKNICGCCGFIYQPQPLSACNHSLSSVCNLGISTFIFFRTILNLIFLMGLMAVTYSAYALVSNITASYMSDGGVDPSVNTLSFLSISLGAKQISSNGKKIGMYMVEVSLGTLTVVVMGVAFVGIKYFQRQQQVRVQMLTKSAAQYSVVIQNMPTGLSITQVQNHLNTYFNRLKELQSVPPEVPGLTISKYNEGKPFYFHEQEFTSSKFKKILQRCQELKKEFIQWIIHRASTGEWPLTPSQRQQRYSQYQSKLKQKNNKCKQLTERIKMEFKQKNREDKTTVFLTFQTNYMKNFMLEHNESDIFSRLKGYLPCCGNNQKRFKQVGKEGKLHRLRIFPAPQPQDIVWTNIGIKNCQKYSRKFLTFTASLVLLCVSFAIVYGLSLLKNQSSSNLAISLTISLTISGINLLLLQVIAILTKYQRDYTITNYQTSLVIKSVVAQLVNLIIVPLFANYFIKKNIYGREGLVMDVFLLSITFSFLGPVARMLEVPHFWKIGYGMYMSKPFKKLGLNQYQLNAILEGIQFEAGCEYVYILSLYLFMCFFISLQPIIPIFAILGLLAMYWAQKYSLFHRCQRPIPGTKILNQTISQIIYFGPAAYTLGSLTWSNFLPDSQFQSAIVPSLISASLSILIFFLPYQLIVRKLYKKDIRPLISFKQNRIFFTSQYDRLNPSTSQLAVRQYRDYLQMKKLQLNLQPIQNWKKISVEMNRRNRRNFLKCGPAHVAPSTFPNQQQTQILHNIIMRQSHNSISPVLIASMILPPSQSRISIKGENIQMKKVQSHSGFIGGKERERQKERNKQKDKDKQKEKEKYKKTQVKIKSQIQEMKDNNKDKEKEKDKDKDGQNRQQMSEEQSRNQLLAEVGQAQSICIKDSAIKPSFFVLSDYQNSHSTFKQGKQNMKKQEGEGKGKEKSALKPPLSLLPSQSLPAFNKFSKRQPEISSIQNQPQQGSSLQKGVSRIKSLPSEKDSNPRPSSIQNQMRKKTKNDSKIAGRLSASYRISSEHHVESRHRHSANSQFLDSSSDLENRFSCAHFQLLPISLAVQDLDKGYPAEPSPASRTLLPKFTLKLQQQDELDEDENGVRESKIELGNSWKGKWEQMRQSKQPSGSQVWPYSKITKNQPQQDPPSLQQQIH